MSQAFKGCTNLVSVSLPSTLQSFAVTADGRAAHQFRECSSLKTINIPAGITEIPIYCFYKCTSLERIALPEGLTSIDNGAFRDCGNLTVVEVPSTIESINSGAFKNHNVNLQFLVPDEATKNKLSDWGYNATTCMHENVVDGVCVDCGQRMDDNIIEVTIGDEKTLYKTFGEALGYASGKTAVLKLLTNVVTNDKYTSAPGDNITFDLDGYTLSFTGNGYYFLNLGKNCFITIKNGKVISKMGTINCEDNAGFTLDGVEITTGYYNGLMFGRKNDAPVCTINNSTFDGGTYTKAITAYLPFPKLEISSGKCTFKNGLLVSSGSTIAELLGGMVLKDAAGNWIYGDALKVDDISKEVTVYDPPFTITKQPVGGTAYFDGKTEPMLSVEVSDPDLSYTYQWYVDGEKVDHLKFPEIDAWLGEHTYYCEVTADGYTVKSDTVTFYNGQSGTEIIANANKPYYTYGETITVTATAAPTGKAPETATTAAAGFTQPTMDQMALFYNGTQVSEAATPGDMLGNRYYTMTASTVDIVKAGADCLNPTLLTARFIGNPYMVDAEETVEVRIERAEITITSATIAEKIYDGTATATVTDVTFDGLVGDDKLELGVDIEATAEFDTPRAETGKDVKVTVDAINGGKAYLRYICKDNTFTLTGQEIKKAQQTLTVPETKFEKTYGDSNFSLGCSTNGDGAISYSVSGDENVIDVSDDGDVKIIGVGTAEVTVTLYEGVNYVGEDSKPISINIARKEVTITADDVLIKVGDPIPKPTDFTYTVKGLVNGEKLPFTPNLTCSAKDSSKAATYDIVVKGDKESDNYTFKYENGTLTISEKTVVAEPVIDPNGGTFRSSQTVTITCDTEGAEIYYTTDGKDPTTESKKYEGTIKVTKTTTVKAIAVLNETNISAVVSAEFTKKPTPVPPIGPVRPEPIEPTDPKYPIINGKELSWADTIRQIQDLPDGGTLTISLNGNTIVPADVIVAIANKNAVVTFVLNAEISFVIDGAKISGRVSAIDLAVGASNTSLSATNFSVIGGTAEKKFTLGSIGIPAKMSFVLDKANAGKFASLMKLNSTTSKYEYVSAAKIGADGTALVDINGKGDYLLIVDTQNNKPGDLNNDMITDTDDVLEFLKSIVDELSMNGFKADYNGDGKANALDAAEILKVVFGLVPDKFDLSSLKAPLPRT